MPFIIAPDNSLAKASPFNSSAPAPFSTVVVVVVVVLVLAVSVTAFRFVIGCGLDPLGGTAAAADAAVFNVVVVVLPLSGTRLAAAGRADGADTAPARADAEPGVGFLAAAVADVVVGDGRAPDRGALVAVVVVVCRTDDRS